MNIGPGGRFTATNVSVEEVIRMAYGVQNFQIVDGPGWIASDRFDVVASMGAPGTCDRANAMLRTLLAERFRVDVRRESRQVPIYALILARPDGRLGPSLKVSSVDCGALDAAARARGAADPPSGRVRCGTRAGRGLIAASAATMDQLARTLSSQLGRPVEDRTGRSGAFDVDLNWTPDPEAGPPAPGMPAAQRPEEFPSLFAAIQEQLGLNSNRRQARPRRS